MAYQKTQKVTKTKFLEANGRGDRFQGFYRCEQKDSSTEASKEEAKNQQKSILFTKTGFSEAIVKILMHYMNHYGNEVQAGSSTYCKVIWSLTHLCFMYNKFNKAQEFLSFLNRELARPPKMEGDMSEPEPMSAILNVEEKIEKYFGYLH